MKYKSTQSLVRTRTRLAATAHNIRIAIGEHKMKIAKLKKRLPKADEELKEVESELRNKGINH